MHRADEGRSSAANPAFSRKNSSQLEFISPQLRGWVEPNRSCCTCMLLATELLIDTIKSCSDTSPTLLSNAVTLTLCFLAVFPGKLCFNNRLMDILISLQQDCIFIFSAILYWSGEDAFLIVYLNCVSSYQRLQQLLFNFHGWAVITAVSNHRVNAFSSKLLMAFKTPWLHQCVSSAVSMKPKSLYLIRWAEFFS